MWERYIYSITNKINGKIYFGSAHSPEHRFRQHINSLKGHRHTSKSLQKDFDVYGIEAFELKTICPQEKINGRSNEFIYMEKHKTYDSKYGYNDLDTAMNYVRRKNGLSYKTSPFKGKKCPWAEQTRRFRGHTRNIIFPENFSLQNVTEHQKAVCEEYLSGKSICEIARERGVSRQAISCSIQRAIKKEKP